MLLRGLTAEDLAAIEALLAERRALLRPLGATLSRNALVLLLLRRGLEVERAQAPQVAGVPPADAVRPAADAAPPPAAPPTTPPTTTPAAIEDPDPEPTIRPPPSGPHPLMCWRVSPETQAEWDSYEEDCRRYHREHPAWCLRNKVASSPCLGCEGRKRKFKSAGTACGCGRVAALWRRTHPNATPDELLAADPPPAPPEPPACPNPDTDLHLKASDDDREKWRRYWTDHAAFAAALRVWEERHRPPTKHPPCSACRVHTGPRGGSPLPGPTRKPCTCGRNLNAA